MRGKKFAVLTSGGDAPAMNAAVYSFSLMASLEGCEVYGVIDGYKGMIKGDYVKVNVLDFRPNIFLSGTAIGSSRSLEFKNDPSVRKSAVEKLKSAGFDGLFVIGGDGSYMGANLINELGMPVVAAPGTIDNDVASSHYTIGFFSAVEEIFQAVRKIRSTSESHSQVTFLEVMGRDCHDLSVVGALAGAVDLVITNQSLMNVDEIHSVLSKMVSEGRKGIVVLVTERIFGEKFGYGLPSLSDLCVEMEKRLGRQVRSNVLGYTQRGAFPTAWDLYVSQRFGMKAFEMFSKENTGVAIGFNGYDFYTTPISEAVSMKKPKDTSIIDFVNGLSR